MKNKLLASLFGAALILGACGGGNDNAADNNDGATDGGTATEGVDAEKVVQTSCVSCHGQNLEGAGSTPGLDDVGSRLSEEEIHTIIVEGKGAMPGGLIKGEEADAVAKYLAEKK